MKFFDALRRLFHKEHEDDDMPYSIVMLLRSPFEITEEVLTAAASRAYDMPYDGSNEMYFVSCDPLFTAVKSGKWFITVLEKSTPYLGDPDEVAQGFKDIRLRTAWTEHRSWVAFDLQNRDANKKESYRVLAQLVSELLDTRCAGIYLPKDNRFTPQSGDSAKNHLYWLAK